MTYPPALLSHHTVLSLEITGGFLKGSRLDFADGLNAVIGGPGSGKTTVLGLLAYVLGDSPAVKNKQVQANLRNGTVRVTFRTRYGAVYSAERAWGAPAHVFDTDGAPVDVALEQLFGADFFGQNEIGAIATDPASQLALLDRFAEEELRDLGAQLAEVERDLAQNAAELVSHAEKGRDLESDAREAPVLAEKLKGLQQGSGADAALINAAHAEKALRERERKAFAAARQTLRAARADAGALATSIGRRLAAVSDEPLLTGANRDVLSALASQLGEVSMCFETALARTTAACAAAEAAIDQHERALAARHAMQDTAYGKVIATSDEENARAAERSRLQQRLAEATAASKARELRAGEARAAAARRRELVRVLSHLRDARFAVRSRVAARLSERLSPTVRVALTQNADDSGYAELLTVALKGTGMKFADVARRVVEALSPEELAAIVFRRDVGRLQDRAGLDEARARKVIDALFETNEIYAIEVVELADRPRIELRHGDQYKDSASVSTGQRCACILPILLLESERPLLIDQPEDSLDGEFIFATVVESILRVKGSRQLLLVTHNPNIPVLGEAERVFVLRSDGHTGAVDRLGTVDEVKDAIERILEGGREAFARRREKYGH